MISNPKKREFLDVTKLKRRFEKVDASDFNFFARHVLDKQISKKEMEAKE